MDKNLIKMENSESSGMTSTWFNAHLFTVNDAPLKFYLMGYNQIEFHQMIKIIEAYGGELSKPDIPGTFVFCELDYPVRAKKWDYYDIKYFDDSIIALKPQDLMNYKLKGSTNQPMYLEHEPEKSMDHRPHRERKNDIKELNKSTKLRNSCARVKPRNHPSAVKNSSGRLDDRVRECYVKLERLDESKIGIEGKYFQIDVKKSPNSSEDEGYSRTTDDSHSPSNRLSSGTSGKRKSGVTVRDDDFSEGENEKIIKWLMKRNSIPANTTRKIWRELLEDKVLPDRHITVWKLSKHYNENLKHHPTFREYINDKLRLH